MNLDHEEILLEEVRDAWGVIRVVEIGDYRFLEFGEAIEQSCTYSRDPAWLEYDYTRAMLIGALCHEAPESALFLGLGGGTLTQACLKFLPLDDVEVIELRPEVPRLAMQYLGLADDPRLTMRILEDCQKRLNHGGWLVINQWGTDDGRPLGAALLRGLYHRHYWEIPVKEGNVTLLVPADLDQSLDLDALTARAAALAPRLGYSLQPLLDVLRPAS
jgi:spermidine synthase